MIYLLFLLLFIPCQAMERTITLGSSPAQPITPADIRIEIIDTAIGAASSIADSAMVNPADSAQITELKKWIQTQLTAIDEKHTTAVSTVKATTDTTVQSAQQSSKYAVYLALIAGGTSIVGIIVTALLTHYLGKASG